jgi:cyclopropane fatty-acyl-phospholipid synthase-like methyltransferase
MSNKLDQTFLTTPDYWGERQKDDLLLNNSIIDYEWLDTIEPFLKKYQHQRFLEIGCCPGHVSAAICSRVELKPEGIDYSPESELYLENMRLFGFPNAKLHKSDIYSFEQEIPFDVVGSFGLIEHFSDPKEVLHHHNRLLRENGLCIVSIPNFRKLQYLYHYLFDRTDLNNHNINSMNLEVFREFAQEANHKIHFLGHVGKLRFWNFDSTGNRVANSIRRVTSRIVRESGAIAGGLLPSGHPYLAPWIVYVGEKNSD